MKERYFALSIGIIFLLLGIAGFLPNLVSMHYHNPASPIPLSAPSVTLDDQYGYLFNLFPTNFLRNVVHIMVGVLGIAGYANFNTARLFNRVFAIVYSLAALMGLFPYTNTMFGLIPLYGHNVWSNGLAALAAAYFGFGKPTEYRDSMQASPSP
jgi:hypothetical protein